jgi:hypothetical protein
VNFQPADMAVTMPEIPPHMGVESDKNKNPPFMLQIPIYLADQQK